MNGFANLSDIVEMPLPERVGDNHPRESTQTASYINYFTLSVYQQPWWLHIAKGDADYRELKVQEDGVTIASLPFIVESNKLNLKLGLPPIWSRLGGPVVSHVLDKDEKADAIHQLVFQLPRNVSYKFIMSPSAPNIELIREELKKAGFKQSTETTYLQHPDDPGILERISAKHKKHFKYAERDLNVIEISAKEFTEFYSANLGAAGKTSYASMKNAQVLIEKGQERYNPQVRVIATKRKSENAPLDAAIACTWDNNRYYLWMVTRRRAEENNPGEPKPHGDAIKLLILKATEHARDLGLTFDADGATTGGAQKLYGEVLQFPHTEEREVFTRNTKTYELYSTLKRQITEHKTGGAKFMAYTLERGKAFFKKIKSKTSTPDSAP